jgi:hypothetical protein
MDSPLEEGRFEPAVPPRWRAQPARRFSRYLRRRHRRAHLRRQLIEELRFARDSPLEGTGFEPSVPGKEATASRRTFVVSVTVPVPEMDPLLSRRGTDRSTATMRHARRLLIASPRRHGYSNPPQGARGREAKRLRALETENAKLQRLLARCGTKTKNGDAHRPFPSAIAHPGSTSCPNPSRVHFNGVNFKRVYDALSAMLTSPR